MRLLLDGVPTPFLVDFEGPQVDMDLHLELALEPFWHSPRVPAGATSAILELVRDQHSPFLIHDLERDRRRPSPAAPESRRVLLARAADNHGPDEHQPGVPFLHIRLHNEWRPDPD